MCTPPTRVQTIREMHVCNSALRWLRTGHFVARTMQFGDEGDTHAALADRNSGERGHCDQLP